MAKQGINPVTDAINIVSILRYIDKKRGLEKGNLEKVSSFSRYAGYMSNHGLIAEKIGEDRNTYVTVTELGRSFIPNTTLGGFLWRKIKESLI